MRIARGSLFYRAGQDGAKKFFLRAGQGKRKHVRGGVPISNQNTLVQIKVLKSSKERFEVLIPLIWTQIVPPSCS